MKRSSGFTLVEMIVILIIVGSILGLSIIGGIRLIRSLEYSFSVRQIISDIKLTQKLADTSCQICRIEFKQGKNTYDIYRNGYIYRACSVSPKVQFYGKSYFSFVQSGYTDVGEVAHFAWEECQR